MSAIVHKRVIISLGSNVEGLWGAPLETLLQAIETLCADTVKGCRVSSVYRTLPVGLRQQPHFLNMIITGSCDLVPLKLLKRLKALERAAGRRSKFRFAPRPLDLDLIDHGGRLINFPPDEPRPALVLPHPEAAQRLFVLVPLREVLPGWRHPGTGERIDRLIARIGEGGRIPKAQNVEKLDSQLFSCDLTE